MAHEPTIKVENLYKSFNIAEGKVDVLRGVTFSIEPGDFAIIYGPSGCGKSTLLHTILGLEKPSKGIVKIFGKEIYEDYCEDRASQFRKKNVGMVYQQSNWVKAINVEENVALPLALIGFSYSERVKKARSILESLDLLGWAKFHPSELSSGQQQKAAFARALIINPRIIIADEPTGNLDFEAGADMIGLLKNFSLQEGKTVLMVTHDLEYLKHANKAVKLFDGQVEDVFIPDKVSAEKTKSNFKKVKRWQDY